MAINIKANGGLKRDPQRIINCESVSVCVSVHVLLFLCVCALKIWRKIFSSICYSRKSHGLPKEKSNMLLVCPGE